LAWPKTGASHPISHVVTNVSPKLKGIGGTHGKQNFRRSFQALGMWIEKLSKKKRIKAAIRRVLKEFESHEINILPEFAIPVKKLLIYFKGL
jgi:hypothetical protein